MVSGLISARVDGNDALAAPHLLKLFAVSAPDATLTGFIKRLPRRGCLN